MKCAACNYEYSDPATTEGRFTNGNPEFYKGVVDFKVLRDDKDGLGEYATPSRELVLYICPKCGTLKIKL